MLISGEEFHALAVEVASWEKGFVGFDYETEGLDPRLGAKAFILGIAYRGHDQARVSRSVLCNVDRFSEALRILLSNPRLKYGASNAKFELAFSRHQFQAEVVGQVWDSEVFARVEDGRHLKYSLQDRSKRVGLTKYPPMLEWLKANKKKGLLHHNAPLELVIPYVEQDAWLEVEHFERQYATFMDWQKSSVPIARVINLEMETTKALFEIEDAGLHVNVDYCKQAMEYDKRRAANALKEFEELTGVPLVNSAKCLAPLFDKHGIPYGRTKPTKRKDGTLSKGGNPSFDEKSLKAVRHYPLVAAIFNHRKPLKRVNTYWENFIRLQSNGIIYPQLNQAKARSGRMSSSDPNSQNWPTGRKDDDQSYPIRRAFEAPAGYWIVSIDYQQMELRKMCDEAGDKKMAQDFVDGNDFHQEVATAASVVRDIAKNGRFAKLYGAGVPRVAETLGVPMEVAARICAALDRASPAITSYCRNLINIAKRSPFSYDWLGRRFYFEKGKEYKAPNYRIQGGCGEIIRIATRDVVALLKSKTGNRSQVILQIHDELCFRMHPMDLHLIPEIKRLMIAAQLDRKILSMDVSVSIGKNLHDLDDYEEGKDYGTAERDKICRENEKAT